MPAAPVNLVIDQGEDYTCQIIWSDERGNAHPLTAPMRLDIVGAGNQPIISLTTPETEPLDGEIPEISYSADIGLIQVHIPRAQTVSLPAGLYRYDFLVTVDDGDVYAGSQQFRLMVGQCVVNQRITEM